jgi:Farnesoic acid 0-methyl transferase
MRPLVLAAVAVAFAVVWGCKIEKIPPAGPSSDDFNRAALGDAWSASGGNWRIDNGELVIDHGYNHPLWLKKPIPRDAVIELDAWSNDDAGDLKVEAWGDGKSFAETTSYTATSYVFIFGGWHNQISAIARMNEHGNDRKTRGDLHVVKGQKYHWRITRKGGHIDWQIDGKPFMSYDDASPLDGSGHSYFGFNDWEAELHFDNLKITPL